MLILNVRLYGQIIQKLELSDTATVYWAGRSDNCQIVLKADQSISRQHFKIFHREESWQLEVVSRFNQIKLGEESIEGLLLKEGVAFTLPPYEFSVENPVAAAVVAGSGMAVGGDSTRNLFEDKESSSADRTVSRVIDRNIQFLLNYRGPESKEDQLFILTKDTYTIGRDSSCDIVIDDARVSRKQFRLVRDYRSYFLVDNQGVNGTYLNKSKVTSKEPIALSSGDRIVILNHRFSFEARDPDYENKVQRVQHLAVVEPVAPPSVSDGAGNFNQSLELMPSSMPPSYGMGDMGISSYNPELYQQQVPPQGPPQEQVKTLNFGKFKIPLTKENKIRLAAVAAVFILFVIAANEEDEFDVSQEVAVVPADPISKLSPEEQKQVKVQYELALDLYARNNFQLAKEELAKVHAKVPSYLDSENLARLIDVGIQMMEMQQQRIRQEREQAEAEERILNTINFCRQKIKPDTSSAEIEDCLAPAIQLNPEHPQIVAIRQEIGTIEEDRRTREAAEALRAAQVEELKRQFNLAREIGEKDPRKGIAAFREFQKLTMPDPKNLQKKAKLQIVKLEKRIKARVNAAIASVRDLVEAGKHRDAIIALEKAMVVAPDDDGLGEEIDRLTEELRKRMQNLYQEAVIEENLGNIETAKDRWRKILEQDIPNGEYYAKAKSRLKKYGGL